MNLEDYFSDLIASVRKSKKYKNLDLPEETLLNIMSYEASFAQSKSELETNFRKKLHNIIAPYLEKIDYQTEILRLTDLSVTPNEEQIKVFSTDIMKKHASSRERLPYLSHFYKLIFSTIGIPDSIFDLACALNPLALPWMDLPVTTIFLAYDLHKPRIDFLNSYFSLYYPSANAIHQDIFVSPPQISADCAFFFKEAHRLEKREPNATKKLFDALQVKFIVVTLPATDLSGHHSLEDYHTNLIERSIPKRSYLLMKQKVGQELIFFIKKP